MACCGRRANRDSNQYQSVIVTWLGEGMQKIPGPVTGKLYRFNGMGGEALVDQRDLAGILNIPHMQIIST